MRYPAVLAGVAVALVAGLALWLTHSDPRLPLRPAVAIRSAMIDPHVVAALRTTHWTSVDVTALAQELEKVSFFAHGRVVVEAAVQSSGHVQQVIDYRQRPVPYGNWLAYQPAMLIGLATLFVLSTAVTPWRRIRNLDVAALLSLLAPVVLLQLRYLGASVLAAVPGLVYLLLRCAWTGLRPGAPSGALAPAGRGPGTEAGATTPLLTALTPRLNAGARVRLLRLLLLLLVLTFVMIGFGSTDAVDVIFAVMEGATRLLHGVLPYGHMPGDVIHGDTYPLLSYLLYVPLAWRFPVNSIWDSVDSALVAAVMFAVLSAWGLHRALAGPRRTRAPALDEAGLRAALAWLTFPPLLVTVSTGTTDVALSAMLTGALLLWRRAGGSTGLLAAAAWFKLAPAALLPIWLAPLRGRRLLAALGAIAGVSVPLGGLLVALGGPSGPASMLHAIAYQFSRGSPMSVWASPEAQRYQPLLQAAVVGLIAGATIRLRRDPGLAQDRGRMAALSAAILIGLQLAANYWAFLYLVWLVPLVSLSLLDRGEAALAPAGRALPEVATLPSAAALAR